MVEIIHESVSLSFQEAWCWKSSCRSSDCGTQTTMLGTRKYVESVILLFGRKTTHDSIHIHTIPYERVFFAYADVSARGGDGGGRGALAFFGGSVRLAVRSPVLPAKREFLSAIAASQALEARGAPGSSRARTSKQPLSRPLCVLTYLSREFFQKSLACALVNSSCRSLCPGLFLCSCLPCVCC